MVNFFRTECKANDPPPPPARCADSKNAIFFLFFFYFEVWGPDDLRGSGGRSWLEFAGGHLLSLFLVEGWGVRPGGFIDIPPPFGPPTPSSPARAPLGDGSRRN